MRPNPKHESAEPVISDEDDGRARRCVATGERTGESRLVRFALDPQGVVTPDVAAKLPGRGVWVLADRQALEAARLKGGFQRGFKGAAKAPEGLADQVEALLAKRCLDLLGMARKAGDLVLGADAVESGLRQQKPAWLLEAADGAADGREKILGLASAIYGEIPVTGCFTAAELGVALGRDRVVHASLSAGRLAQRWAVEIGRLSGFRAVTPGDWRRPIVD
jgi:predicted RNA-binding protein YlxR (DUF448 family)